MSGEEAREAALMVVVVWRVKHGDKFHSTG